MDPTGILTDLGFGEYEARAYVALLRRNPVNGYELAKLSDIPRGNIYAVLQKLEDRGAIVRVDTPDGTRYAPVSPEELLRRMEGRFERTVKAAAQLLNRVAAPVESAPVSNIGGYQVLLEHARSLLARAQEHLLLAIWPDEAKALAGDVAAAAERGVGIRTLCLAGCPQECGACRGHIHRYRLSPEQAARWLVLVADRAEVLAGEIRLADGTTGDTGTPEEEAAQGIRTRQRLLVDLTASYIRHSIALAAVLEDAGANLGRLLSPPAREVLAATLQEVGLEEWLAHLSQLSGSRDPEIM